MHAVFPAQLKLHSISKDLKEQFEIQFKAPLNLPHQKIQWAEPTYLGGENSQEHICKNTSEPLNAAAAFSYKLIG